MAKSAPAPEKKVRIRIPRDANNSGPVFVSVNERTWLIRRGEEVEVPECVADAIAAADRATEAKINFEEAARR